MSELLDLIVNNEEKLKLLKKEQSKKEPKKLKRKKEAPDEEEEFVDLKEPSTLELQESEKILQTIRNKETVRSKKRKIHETLIESKKLKTKDSVEFYLNQWKNEREKFKYKKSRQIYIQKFLFDESKISEKIWDLCLSYLEASQGSSRKLILENAKKVIDDLDNKESKTEQESVKYKRARELLQNLS